MFLTIENLTKQYGALYAVKDFSCQANEGEFLCILGPSGCGKTTVLRAIGGFLDDVSGSIVLDGKEITRTPPHLRPVSTVFQSYGLFPHMTVLENVMYGLKFRELTKSDAKQRSLEYLELVKLEDHANKRISALSGGQQQRVALARSLVLNPKVLLLDEPLSNLDAKLRVQMREEISRLQKLFNLTTIFVTHDQDEAFALADRILLMEKGVLVQEGSPKELYETPNSPFSLSFIGETSVLQEDPLSYIRPQRVKFAETGTPAMIEKKWYRGDRFVYSAIISEKEILIETLNDGHSQEYEVGDRVNLEYTSQTLE